MMEDKNKKLEHECSVLTRKILEMRNEVPKSGQDIPINEYIDPKHIHLQNTRMDGLPTEVKVKMIAHNDACTCLAFNPTADILATGGADKCVKLWNTKKMPQLSEMEVLKSKVPQSVTAVCFSPDNELFMQGSSDNKLQIYRLKSNTNKNVKLI